ncbi:uncharacterized mitochondrial protein AtMg00810-like [Benincasa hispida]|uniref:uncharacterized mitochondrial protein AtMg00810-like n=1 Tax=Benincasa hispida TaxID=102211 RepID=UPI001900BF4B|nr:uncharacterized mitochondrial protein AtMg00810-like [Benincasa hispida]
MNEEHAQRNSEQTKYVADVVLTGNARELIDRLITALDSQFSLKDLGPLSYFLGIQVTKLTSSLALTQAKYIDDLLVKLDLCHLKLASTPSIIRKALSISDGTPLPDSFLYRSRMDALQYVTQTRPYIAYIFNNISQFLKQSTDASNVDDRKSMVAYCVFVGNTLVS